MNKKDLFDKCRYNMVLYKTHGLKVFIFALVACFALAFISSCTKTIYVPVKETEYIERISKDTIVSKDSVYIKEFIKGDTIYLTEYRYKDRYKTKIERDTICKTDTITRVEYKEKVIVEKYVPKWCRLFGSIGIFAVVLIIGVIVYRIRKHKLL